jgi:hypothetical protein
VGLEADCRVRFAGQASSGRARLEEKELIFRGDFRLKIPFAGIRELQTRRGVLEVDFAEGRAAFELGDKAETWAEKIRRPRPLIEKLGVKPGTKVAVIGLFEAAPGLVAEVEERAGQLLRGRLGKGCDLVLIGMTRREELERLTRCREAIEPEGAVWVIWPKGNKAFREDDVRAAGPGARLVDVKVVSVSETLSGLKMMVPRAQRGRP